ETAAWRELEDVDLGAGDDALHGGLRAARAGDDAGAMGALADLVQRPILGPVLGARQIRARGDVAKRQMVVVAARTDEADPDPSPRRPCRRAIERPVEMHHSPGPIGLRLARRMGAGRDDR